MKVSSKSPSDSYQEVEEAILPRTYHGHTATSERPVFVTVRDSRGPKVLAHHVRHSPTGFEWGYSGSGPGELSRCILLDVFGTQSCPDTPAECQCVVKWVESSYHAFKEDVIAGFEKDEDWKLNQTDVADWVFDYLKDKDQGVRSLSLDEIVK